jgi:hypothetical protein
MRTIAHGCSPRNWDVSHVVRRCLTIAGSHETIEAIRADAIGESQAIAEKQSKTEAHDERPDLRDPF